MRLQFKLGCLSWWRACALAYPRDYEGQKAEVGEMITKVSTAILDRKPLGQHWGAGGATGTSQQQQRQPKQEQELAHYQLVHRHVAEKLRRHKLLVSTLKRWVSLSVSVSVSARGFQFGKV